MEDGDAERGESLCLTAETVKSQNGRVNDCLGAGRTSWEFQSEELKGDQAGNIRDVSEEVLLRLTCRPDRHNIINFLNIICYTQARSSPPSQWVVVAVVVILPDLRYCQAGDGTMLDRLNLGSSSSLTL